jgi:ATP-dependent helicase/nuclease subunit B
MVDPETARTEWNARDFGTVAHEVLEKWGQDTEAREYNKTEALEEWFGSELDRVVAAWFGRRVPLAVRIQAESLRQRLAWLARVQACERAAGWQVVDVERKVEIAFGTTTVVAKIDRIDRHEGTGAYRVIDYKTGRVERGVAAEHRSRITSATRLPPHLGADSAAVVTLSDKGKPAAYRWTNLQLPLYALALVRRDLPLPQPCYLTLGSSEDRVKLLPWEGFSATEMAAAEACAELLVTMIAAGVFGPPAERVTYDDFRDLAAGRTLVDASQGVSTRMVASAAANAIAQPNLSK